MLDVVERNIIFSIKPQYASEIFAGRKTVELRRRFATEAVIGAVAFIYASAPVQSMIGYARIADVQKIRVKAIWRVYGADACISKSDFKQYFDGLDYGFVIALEEITPFRTSIPATVLRDRFGFTAPQSYRYASMAYCALIA